jgi:flavin-binding protein dodecin
MQIGKRGLPSWARPVSFLRHRGLTTGVRLFGLKTSRRGQLSTDPRGATTIGRSTESEGEVAMSVYRVLDVIGTSSSSWEEAAAEAITTAGGSVRDIRVAEVTRQDIVVGDTGDLLYRTKIQLSFKYESE